MLGVPIIQCYIKKMLRAAIGKSDTSIIPKAWTLPV